MAWLSGLCAKGKKRGKSFAKFRISIEYDQPNNRQYGKIHQIILANIKVRNVKGIVGNFRLRKNGANGYRVNSQSTNLHKVGMKMEANPNNRIRKMLSVERSLESVSPTYVE